MAGSLAAPGPRDIRDHPATRTLRGKPVDLLDPHMSHEATTYSLLEGRGILVCHFGDVVRLTPGTPVRLPTAPPCVDALPHAV